jgi:hypothetical protein
MKVELLVNLKIASGRIISAGTIFSDETEPIPEFIMKRLARNKARIISGAPAKPKVTEPVAVPKTSKPVKEAVPAPAKDEIPAPVKKVLGKKTINK